MSSSTDPGDTTIDSGLDLGPTPPTGSPRWTGGPTPRETSTVAPTGPRERLLSLDVFRGMTIAGMLLVNNPGTWGAIYPPLKHAEWHGWTPTDLIFPFFLFIVGITTWISLESRRARGATDGELVRQIVKRGLIIIALGLLLNMFPYEKIERFTQLRYTGVLQRIGLAYMFGALLAFKSNLKQQIVAAGALLIGYQVLMTLVPVPGQYGLGGLYLDTKDQNLAAYVDRLLLEGHLWVGSRTWDPEGLLSTIPAIGTVILGVIAGRWINGKEPLTERIAGLFAAGSIVIVVGLMWNWSFPINKALWTSSYVAFTAGMACVTLATCMWIIDLHRVTRWTKPFVIYGVNPIVAFWGSGAMARLIYSVIKVPCGETTLVLQKCVYENAYASWLPDKLASLAFAVTFVLLWLGILSILYRKRIFLKV